VFSSTGGHPSYFPCSPLSPLPHTSPFLPSGRAVTQFDRDVAQVVELFPDAAPDWITRALQADPLAGVGGLVDVMISNRAYERRPAQAKPLIRRAQAKAAAGAKDSNLDYTRDWAKLGNPDVRYQTEAFRLLSCQFPNVCKPSLRLLMSWFCNRYAPTLKILQDYFAGREPSSISRGTVQ